MTAERCGMGDRQRRWWRGLPVIAALGALLGSLALAPSPVSAVPTESGPTVSPAYSGGPLYTPLERVGSSRFSRGLPRVWLTVVMTSGGQFVSVFESEFELDGGESAEAALASPPIVGPFDPNDDLDS